MNNYSVFNNNFDVLLKYNGQNPEIYQNTAKKIPKDILLEAFKFLTKKDTNYSCELLKNAKLVCTEWRKIIYEIDPKACILKGLIDNNFPIHPNISQLIEINLIEKSSIENFIQKQEKDHINRLINNVIQGFIFNKTKYNNIILNICNKKEFKYKDLIDMLMSKEKKEDLAIQCLTVHQDLKNEGLHAGIYYQSQSFIEKLIAAGADVLYIGQDSFTLLCRAAGGSPDILKYLLINTKCIEQINKITDKETPLSYAVRLGLLENVKILIKYNADLSLTYPIKSADGKVKNGNILELAKHYLKLKISNCSSSNLNFLQIQKIVSNDKKIINYLSQFSSKM